jgi:hypothetical protein
MKLEKINSEQSPLQQRKELHHPPIFVTVDAVISGQTLSRDHIYDSH